MQDQEQDQDKGQDREAHLPVVPDPRMAGSGDWRRPAKVRRPVTVERHLWRHSIESSALVIVGLIVGAAIVPHTWPLFWLTGFLAVLTVVVWFIAAMTTGSPMMANYLGAWGVVVTAWFTAARLLGSVWQADLLGPLFLALAILAPAGAAIIAHNRDDERKKIAAQEIRKNTAELQRWEMALSRADVPGVRVTDVVPTPVGRMVFGRLGKATSDRRAITFDTLASRGHEIAVSLRLAGDAVSFEQRAGRSSADFIMHVRERQGPREDYPLPAENHPISVAEPLGIGKLDSGREYRLLVREVTVMIIGVKGSGKSNLLNVFLAQLARCPDALVFMIDLKGGRTARPWLMPWVMGHTRKPVVDWLATTRQEADMMLDALMALGTARSQSGEGWEKIEPSAGTPAIVLICDESAVLTGHQIKSDDGLSNYKLAQKLAQLVELYRSECIDEIVSALRGNVDIQGSTAVKAMSEARIGLRVTQASDGRMVFPDDNAAADMLSRITDKGDGLVKIGADLSPRVHFYRIGGEKQITAIALATADDKPDIEQAGQDAMGDLYAERWDRAAELTARWRAQEGLHPSIAEEFAQGEAARDGGSPEDQKFYDVIAGVEDPEEALKRVDPRQKLMRQLLRQRGLQGYTVGAIVRAIQADGHTTVHRGTVQKWLAADKDLGYVQATGAPLSRWIWVARIDIPD